VREAGDLTSTRAIIGRATRIAIDQEDSMDLNQAIEKHAEWKVKFRTAITKKETMDADTISRDNCCELGKWLHGDGRTTLGKLGSFSDCVLKHAAFHAEAGKVARTINSGNFTQAEAMLGGGSSYARASTEVGMAISRLKKEITA
jgi:methyl-accepting chemotaxis protein